jgi:nitroreductase
MLDEIHASDLFEIIRTTRSMRRLKPDLVPDGLIRKILEADVCAPSGGNMQRGASLSSKIRRSRRRSGPYTSARGTSKLRHGIEQVNRPLA